MATDVEGSQARTGQLREEGIKASSEGVGGLRELHNDL